MDRAIEDIARRILLIDTLEERGRDHLDFHDRGVVLIRKALEAAYRAGHDAALSRSGSTQ